MKTYRISPAIGRARHVVSFHDGKKRHRDGSAFFDLHICGNKRALATFTRGLREQGYSES